MPAINSPWAQDNDVRMIVFLEIPLESARAAKPKVVLHHCSGIANRPACPLNG
jgi:hypothetical protein